MKAYCIYCKSGSEEKLLQLLTKEMRLNYPHSFDIFYPVRIINQKKRGVWSRIDQPLLPGYLFLYLDEEETLPLFLLHHERDIYKILRYSDGTMELKGDDAHYADWVFNNRGRLEPSRVIYQPKQPIKVIDGPLKDLRGNIVKVDKHHKRVIVEAMFAGAMRKIHLSADFVEQIDE